MARTIAQINKELNYLDVCYQRLTIKTKPYEVRKAALLEEKEKVLKMSEKELAKLEREKKNYKESQFKGELTDPNTGKDIPHPTIITDVNDDIRA